MNPLRSIPLSDGDPAIGVTVVGAGTGWLVVDKPSGMSIHNDPGRDLRTVIVAALGAGRLPAVGPIDVLHAVHRIDRETSGLVLLAGDAELPAFFGRQFADRTVRKEYLAVVHGDPAGSGHGVWSWPLTADAGGRRDPAGRGKRLACTTRWAVREYTRHYALIACEPLSGRTHQIRRHARLAGHPVVGDRRYGSSRAVQFLDRHRNFRRLGLHAHTLTVRLPGASRETTFRSKGLPDALRALLADDR